MKPKPKNKGFFKSEEWWEQYWQDMPEYHMDDQSPHKEIVVKFRNKEDMIEFQKVISQKFTIKTKSIWYPELIIEEAKKFLYVDEK